MEVNKKNRFAVIALDGAEFHDTVANLTIKFSRKIASVCQVELLEITPALLNERLERLGVCGSPSKFLHDGTYKLDHLSGLFGSGDNYRTVNRYCEKLENVLSELLSEVSHLFVSNIQTAPLNVALSVSLFRALDKRSPKTFCWVHDLWNEAMDAQLGRISNIETVRELAKVFRNPWPNTEYLPTTHYLGTRLSEYLGVKDFSILPPVVDTFELFGFSRQLSEILTSKNILGSECIGFVPSRMSNRKNFPKAVRIFRHIINRLPDSKLIFSGAFSNDISHSTRQMDELLGLADRHDMLSNIVLLVDELEEGKKLHMSDIAALYNLSDFVLCTSTTEEFYLPGIESNLMGTPVFAPSLQSITSWAEGFIEFFELQDEDQTIANKIVSNPDVCKSQNSRAYLRKFDLESISNKFKSQWVLGSAG